MKQLTNPDILPLRTIDNIQSPILVVAPHPDDETLGCGGAIALLRSLNCHVRVMVISDGTLSHPRSRKYPAAKLKALRESETIEALSILGIESQNVDFLGLQDGSISTYYSQKRTNAIIACCEKLIEIVPQTIFLPWRYDPHPDHRGTWSLINTALSCVSLKPRIIEYPIWDWDPEQRKSIPESEQIDCWRLDIAQVVELKTLAIQAYRSQTTDLIDDDPEGFRLSPQMLANFARPWEVYLELGIRS